MVSQLKSKERRWDSSWPRNIKHTLFCQWGFEKKNFSIANNDLQGETASWSGLKIQTGSFHGKPITNYIFIKYMSTNM